MKTITLTKVIKEECKDEIFNQYFQRELLINEIAHINQAISIELRQLHNGDKISTQESYDRLKKN